MEDAFLKGIEQEFCDICGHKEECQIPCPEIIREILGLNKDDIL